MQNEMCAVATANNSQWAVQLGLGKETVVCASEEANLVAGIVFPTVISWPPDVKLLNGATRQPNELLPCMLRI